MTEISGRLQNLMENSYAGLKNLLSADTVLGSPIVTSDGVSIIPVCKITVGFLTGGGEFGSGFSDYPFAGGSGTGMSVSPIGFLVCNKTSVKMVSMDEKSVAERLTESVSDILKSILSKNDEK